MNDSIAFLRLYGWAKKYVSVGTKSISLEQLRKVLGLESVKDGNIIQEAPLPIWGKSASEGFGHGDLGDQSENGLKCCTRLVGAVKASAGDCVDICDQGASVPKGDSKGKSEFKHD
jgi:hypothetical protein